MVLRSQFTIHAYVLQFNLG